MDSNQSNNSQKNNLSNKVSKFFNKYGFYVVVMVCLIIVCGAFYMQRYSKQNAANKVSKNVEISNNSETKDSKSMIGVDTNNRSNIDNAKEVKNTTENKNFAKNIDNNSSDNVSKPTNAQVQQSAIKPVNGKVVLGYTGGKDDTFARDLKGNYINVLGEYVEAKQGLNVVAALDGKVETAKDGTVVIVHQNGLRTTYKNLDKISVKENQVIKQNTKLGVIGDTDNAKNLIVDCDHLYFQVDKLDGGVYRDINPQTIVKYDDVSQSNQKK